MKNLAKLKFKTESQKGKQKPMFAAKTARAVPQLRKVAKALTGYKEGGTMTKEESIAKEPESESKRKGRERAKKVKRKVKDFGEKATGFVLEIIGKNRGGVVRPKPTFRGKVLKPKPITRRGVGIAIRGFGKAFKKGK